MGWDKDKKKSDDSKLADAAAANDADRKEGNRTAEEKVQALPEILQAAAVEKAAAGDVAGSNAAEIAIRKLTQIVESLSAKVSKYESQPANLKDTAVKCGTCHQAVAGCKGEHIWALVIPKNYDLVQYFQGVLVNGTKFFGRCLVPSNMLDSIMAAVARWEYQERRLMIPGGKVFGDIDFSQAQGNQGFTTVV